MFVISKTTAVTKTVLSAK